MRRKRLSISSWRKGTKIKLTREKEELRREMKGRGVEGEEEIQRKRTMMMKGSWKRIKTKRRRKWSWRRIMKKR